MTRSQRALKGGAFRGGSGRKIEGEIGGVRSYEDFVAVAVIGGEGNVTMKFNVVGGELGGVGEVSSKAAYLAVLGLLLLLLAAVWLERRIG